MLVISHSIAVASLASGGSALMLWLVDSLWRRVARRTP